MPADARMRLLRVPQAEEGDDDDTPEQENLLPKTAGVDGELSERDQARVEELKQKIADAWEREAERVERRDELEALFAKRIKEMEEEIQEKKDLGDEKYAELELLRCPPIQEPPPPGPQCLGWIMSEYFNLVATIVIVSNITTMIMELINKEKEKTFFWLDQSFMVFYVMEVTIKFLLLKRTMFIGKMSVVWWNWLDFIIVLSGVVDMWMQPLAIELGIIQGGHSLKILSFLRMLRLLRILKILGMFMKADLSWSQGDTFQTFIMGVIAFNSVLMGLEADIPDFWGWYWVEQMLLVIFSFEVACRLKFWGCQYFYHKDDIAWNLLDFIIVAGGIVDQWMMPAIALVKTLLGMKSGGKGNIGQIMMMLRMARLLRILRLVRLVKSIPPLFLLVVGIMKAMQGMMWVVVLTGVLLYAFSLLSVKLIGHGLVFGGHEFCPDDVSGIFPSIFDSMFVLFKAMNGDWAALEPLFHVIPISKMIFFFYTVISTWGILSILTAVVSENMINATEDHRQEIEEEEEDKRRQEQEEALEQLFADIDDDKSGILSKSEFERMLLDAPKAKRLREAACMPESDLKQLFSFLSKIERKDSFSGKRAHQTKADEPTVTRQDFIEGLKSEGREVSERSVMRLERRIRGLEVSLKKMGKTSIPAGDCPGMTKEVREFIDTEVPVGFDSDSD